MDAEDLYFEGLDLFAERQWRAAVNKFKESASADPSYVDAYHGIARACRSYQARSSSAITCASRMFYPCNLVCHGFPCARPVVSGLRWRGQ